MWRCGLTKKYFRGLCTAIEVYLKYLGVGSRPSQSHRGRKVASGAQAAECSKRVGYPCLYPFHLDSEVGHPKQMPLCPEPHHACLWHGLRPSSPSLLNLSGPPLHQPRRAPPSLAPPTFPPMGANFVWGEERQGMPAPPSMSGGDAIQWPAAVLKLLSPSQECLGDSLVVRGSERCRRHGRCAGRAVERA